MGLQKDETEAIGTRFGGCFDDTHRSIYIGFTKHDVPATAGTYGNALACRICSGGTYLRAGRAANTSPSPYADSRYGGTGVATSPQFPDVRA